MRMNDKWNPDKELLVCKTAKASTSLLSKAIKIFCLNIVMPILVDHMSIVLVFYYANQLKLLIAH